MMKTRSFHVSGNVNLLKRSVVVLLHEVQLVGVPSTDRMRWVPDIVKARVNMCFLSD